VIRNRLLRAIRRWNRLWLDRLDPDYPPPPPPRPQVSIHAEPTPNPNAMKFVCSVPVPALASDHPLQTALLALDGVKSVFAIDDFVTVTRHPNEDWNRLLPPIEGVLHDQLSRP
jgi:hypothetical protein